MRIEGAQALVRTLALEVSVLQQASQTQAALLAALLPPAPAAAAPPPALSQGELAALRVEQGSESAWRAAERARAAAAPGSPLV